MGFSNQSKFTIWIQQFVQSANQDYIQMMDSPILPSQNEELAFDNLSNQISSIVFRVAAHHLGEKVLANDNNWSNHHQNNILKKKEMEAFESQ